ncbi:MAG TPA: methyltransferase domain-containing protein [Steroidobacteraceae bacterium]
MKHPHWYFTFYSQLFDRGALYAAEARAICQGTSPIGQSVQEIGAGTGGHAAAMLALGVEQLELLDVEEEATDVLRERFAADNRVTIVLGNGFHRKSGSPFDLVYCMYSVATQSCDSIKELIGRIDTVIHRVKPGGRYVFEAIDYEASSKIYPPGLRTCVFDGLEGQVYIESIYMPNALRIVYSGHLAGNSISYTVRMLRFSRREIAEALSQVSHLSIGFENLDEQGRRVLCRVSEK